MRTWLVGSFLKRDSPSNSRIGRDDPVPRPQRSSDRKFVIVLLLLEFEGNKRERFPLTRVDDFKSGHNSHVSGLHVAMDGRWLTFPKLRALPRDSQRSR